MKDSDENMIVLGERLAAAIRAQLENDGSVPLYKLMGELIDALNAWDEAMLVRRH
jgi:hypothetical protein